MNKQRPSRIVRSRGEVSTRSGPTELAEVVAQARRRATSLRTPIRR